MEASQNKTVKELIDATWFFYLPAYSLLYPHVSDYTFIAEKRYIPLLHAVDVKRR